MYSFVDKVIYFYIFICIALLIFNILYIMRRKDQVKRREKKEKAMEKAMEKVRADLSTGGTNLKKHGSLLEKKLEDPEQLTAWYTVLFQPDSPLKDEEKTVYIVHCRPALLALAWKYNKHPAMERAFFAYVLSLCIPWDRDGANAFIAPLLAYLENSTIYCRENVLQALYSIGDAQAIGKALDYLGTCDFYHHPRLISDGLRRCPSDQAQLVRYLWGKCKGWPQEYGVAVVQFATGISAEFSDMFYNALIDQSTRGEIRLAIIRYFRRYADPRAGAYFCRLLENNTESSMAIVAAQALDAYPGEKTRQVLKHALCSSNWYVRKNAALSLKALGITWEDVEEIRQTGDRFAMEMLEYIKGKDRAAG